MEIVVKSKSSGSNYTVKVFTENEIPVITCSCPAGENGKACKHRFALLDGDWTEVTLATHTSEELKGFLQGSQLLVAIEGMREAEKTVAQAKADHTRRKNAVASLMQGRVV